MTLSLSLHQLIKLCLAFNVCHIIMIMNVSNDNNVNYDYYEHFI